MKLLAALLATAAAENGDPQESVLLAVAMLVVALLLIALELLIVSFGVLGLGAVLCAVYSVYLAFGAGALYGWIFLVAAPVCSAVVLGWGLRRLQNSSLVPQATVADDAGYHHRLEALGIGEGAEGVMVTRARPTGRARFDGGECDVQVQGVSLDAGTRVHVRHIEGPIVFVSSVDDADTSSDSPDSDT